MRVEYTRRAQLEALAARDAFASAEPRTVDGFEHRLDEAVDRLARYPAIGRHVGSNVRALPLRPYPFILLYRVTGETIQIVGIPHAHTRWP